jgi:hypothetical protein
MLCQGPGSLVADGVGECPWNQPARCEPQPTARRAELTFKRNVANGRHGWLRLTSAYSLKIVEDILARHGGRLRVLDPFSLTHTPRRSDMPSRREENPALARRAFASIVDQLAELQPMNATSLQRRYEELFGEPSRSRNKDYLRKKIAYRIQEIAKGGPVPEGARTRG